MSEETAERIPIPAGAMESQPPSAHHTSLDPAAAIAWADAQREESAFWGDCSNTYGEETKQFAYMRRMGFPEIQTWRAGPYAFNGEGKSILDVGGGPCSVLLKFINRGRCKVIDPGFYPDWVQARYAACGIELERIPAEEMHEGDHSDDIPKWNLALLYNCLQHVIDPERIVRNVMGTAEEVRIFEWIDIPVHDGHPHELHAADLDRWTGRRGRVEYVSENGAHGKAWIL